MDKFKNAHPLLFKLLCGVTAGVVTAGIFLLGYGVRGWIAPDGTTEIEHILKIIERNYDGEFDVEEFIHAAVSGSLDKYSAYYTPEEYEEINLSREGVVQERLGLSFLSGKNRIYSVDGNSPAERAGITEGGVITGIKEKAALEFTPVTSYQDFSTAYSAISAGKQIELRIEYEQEETFTLTADTYNRSYVFYQSAQGAYGFEPSGENWAARKRQKPLISRIISPNGDDTEYNFVPVTVPEGKAYIKFEKFTGDAHLQLEAALGQMKKEGITDVVLDLRNNGGGYMNILTSSAGLLIEGKDRELVSTVKYKSGDTYGFYTSANSYSEYNYTKITVLANDGTASASEALIGAMLDYDRNGRVKIILSKAEDGTFRTYGKGIMQTTFENTATGSAIKLTTAHIYWPKSGRCIHGEGINLNMNDGRIIGVDAVSGVDAELAAAFN